MFKKIFFLLSVLAVCCLGGTFPDNTGIVLTDTKGKTYDIDALIKAGKHIVIHQTFSGWGCVSAGQGLDRIFKKYGSNKEDLIFIVAVISNDSESKMIQAYGFTPDFPMVLKSGKSVKVANLFGMPNSGGPTWIMHPKLFYDKTSYSETTLSNNIAKALKDDCNKVKMFTLAVTSGTGGGEFKVGEVVTIIADSPPANQTFDKWTGSVQTVNAIDDIYSATTTIKIFDNNTTVVATYQNKTGIVNSKVKSSNGTVSQFSSTGMMLSNFPKDVYQITIFTVAGKAVVSFSIDISKKQKIVFERNKLISGNYLIKIMGNKKTIIKYRFID